ncbi:MAG: hypothetical protein ACKPKO_22335, partial [Candidatus Fonsibacter sp.]
MRAKLTLALVLLDKLLDDGWRVGTPPPAHSMNAARTFAIPMSLCQRTYWRRLAMLDRLCAAGLGKLPSRMSPQYYNEAITAYDSGNLANCAIVQHASPRRQQS